MASLANADVIVLPLPSTAFHPTHRRFQTTRRTFYNSGLEKNHD